MHPLDYLSLSHIIFTSICFIGIVLIPRLFLNQSERSKKILLSVIVFIILINQGMDFYREGYLDQLKLGLPLHLCDFTSFAVILYFFTKKRMYFIFAFFFGIAGGGMSLLTPDVVYGFPSVPYIQNQIGHSMILLGVTYAMIIDKQRPHFRDVYKVILFTTALLLFMYFVNYLLGPPANYWFLAEKPIGDNVMKIMRPEPYHIIDVFILAVIVCYLMYVPYIIKDIYKKT